MKKSLLMVAAAVAAFVMTGCVSTHTNDGAEGPKVTVEGKKFASEVVVGAKTVSGEATVHNVLGLFTWGANEFADEAFVSTSGLTLRLVVSATDAAKQGATYQACNAVKADKLLATKYNLQIKDYFVYKCVTCKVTGFPATFKAVK